MKPASQPIRVRTYKHHPGKRAKTARQGRRGLHDFLECYQGVSGFRNIVGLPEFKTTYGEVTEAGIQVLSDKFKALKQGRVFYDLGCGVGKVVLGLSFLNENLQCRGVEIVPERVRSCQQALERVNAKIAKRVQISLGSMLDPGIVNFAEADWVFYSNMCLDSVTNEGVVRGLDAMKPGGIIICSRELPVSQSKFHLIEKIIVPMTWSSSSTCCVYRRTV
jgi:precorrin-6B methylase 2